MTPAQSFLRRLDETIDAHKMLDHPFYRTWTMGELSRDALREYAKQYYHFVQAFPTLVSAVHANTPRLDVRQELLENLIEEERGDDNHPGLWVKFTAALGVSEEAAAATPLLPETREAIATMRSLTRDGSYLDGVAALYAYESQIPRVAAVKIEGLRAFYGITGEEALRFFTVHEAADVEHAGAERKILERHAVTDEARASAVAAAAASADAMLRLLDGVHERYVKAA